MDKTPIPNSQGPEVPFPFDAKWQVKLLKLILSDEGQTEVAMRHLKPQYFATPDLRWVFQETWNYWAKYGRVPTLGALNYINQQHGSHVSPTVQMILQEVQNSTLAEAEFLRDELVTFCRQNHFFASFKEAQSLWNHGKRLEAMDQMRSRFDELQQIEWKHRERVFWGEELSHREQLREQKHEELGDTGDAISTGVPDLDQVLNGGLSPGELGVWIAYAKGGKSTLLMNLGAVAVSLHKYVIHFVLEGSVQQVLDRYDAWFAHEAYWKVKHGKMADAAFSYAFQQAEMRRRNLLVVGLLDKFDYTILDINAELMELKRVHGIRPDMVIIDYGDLLMGRHGPYQSPWMGERDSFRDMKLLANRGYAVWTASQAQRPNTKSYDEAEHILKTAQVAGAIEKARVCDFMGSINSTVEEKKAGTLRLYAELYRDNQAGKLITLATEPDQMRFVGVQKEAPSEYVSTPGATPPTPVMGYKQPPPQTTQEVPPEWKPVQKVKG